jgi:hypothetical protein
LTGLVTAYVFLVLPIEETKRNGLLRQSPFSLLIFSALLYWGVGILVTDLRDEKTTRVGAEDSLWWAAKGLAFRYGIWTAIALMLIAWYLYLRSIAVPPF